MVSTKDIKAATTELLGTFFIVFVTCWSFTVLRDKETNYLALALANGLVVSACVWAGITASGSHFNPVITIVKLFIRNMSVGKATLYLISQLIGSFLATILVMLLSPDDAKLGADKAFRYPEKRNITNDFQTFIMEFTLSMLYVFVYFATIIDKRAPSNIFGFALGAVIIMGTLAAGPLTGGVVNPIRIFGPYLINGQLEDSVVYWLATLAGGIFAGFYYDFFLLKDDELEDEDEDRNGNAMWSKDDVQEASNLKY